MKPTDFFSESGQKLIVEAIKEAELNTSGEVRVHIEGHCSEEVMDRAAWVFQTLDMHKTEARNGVLFYLAVTDKKFAILGDIGINQKVPENFWGDVKNAMLSQFKEGEFAQGLSDGIRMAGVQLGRHFPYQDDDVNELSDDISFGK